MGIKNLLGFGDDEPDRERETKTETGTKTVTKQFKQHKAKIEFGDDFKKVTYDDAEQDGDLLLLREHEAEDFQVSTHGIKFGDPEPRRVPIHAFTDMKILWDFDLTAVAEIEVEREYRRYHEDDDWDLMMEVATETDPEVTIWETAEWEAHNDE